jgi:hypothetical protein
MPVMFSFTRLLSFSRFQSASTFCAYCFLLLKVLSIFYCYRTIFEVTVTKPSRQGDIFDQEVQQILELTIFILNTHLGSHPG